MTIIIFKHQVNKLTIENNCFETSDTNKVVQQTYY